MARFEIRTVRVTHEDVAGASRDSPPDPLVSALQRATGTRWKISAWGVALEMAQPYRTIVLPGTALRAWQVFQHTRQLEPFEFTAEICSPTTGQTV